LSDLTLSIGRAISLRLAKLPLKALALHYSRSKEACEALRDSIVQSHPSLVVTLHQADLSEISQCERLAKEVLEAHHVVDIFISNAGGAKRVTDILYSLLQSG
jgi:short-subunit dehydrogenase